MRLESTCPRATNLLIGMGRLAPFAMLSVALALLLPESRDQYPALFQSFCKVMSSSIHSIDQFVAVSRFPVVTQVFLSIEWGLVPLLALVIWHQPELLTPNARTMKKWSTWKLLLGLSVVACFGVIYPMVIELRPDSLRGNMLNEWALRSVSESRLWLGLLGSIIIFSVAYWACLIISYVRAISAPLFYKKRGTQ